MGEKSPHTACQLFLLPPLLMAHACFSSWSFTASSRGRSNSKITFFFYSNGIKTQCSKELSVLGLMQLVLLGLRCLQCWAGARPPSHRAAFSFLHSSTALPGDWRSQIAGPSAQTQLHAPAAARAVAERLPAWSVRCCAPRCATTKGQHQAEGLAQGKPFGWGPGWEPGAEPDSSSGRRDVQEQVPDPTAAKSAFARETIWVLAQG